MKKPLEWTSFDVVKKLRNISRVKKVGHAGTLDPLATGLLIICYGKYTKKIEQFQGQRKVYRGKFLLGQTTPSFDLETEVDAEYSVEHITPELVEKVVKEKFVGDIEQIPPQHSAVKINGQRAYVSARKGKEIVLRPRQVNVSQYDINTGYLPEVSFEIECSKGTYIRSLARDLGVALESGAFMTQLERTKIGDYKNVDAVSMVHIGSQEDFFSYARQL